MVLWRLFAIIGGVLMFLGVYGSIMTGTYYVAIATLIGIAIMFVVVKFHPIS